MVLSPTLLNYLNLFLWEFSNNVLIQFGHSSAYASDEDITIYFPISFHSMVTVHRQYVGGYESAWYGRFSRIYNVTYTSFNCYKDNCYWIAIGY